jgi:hypothetical protein
MTSQKENLLHLRTFVLVLQLLLVAACDLDSAKRFDLGRPLPDVRFEVTLPMAISRGVLYERIERLAKEDGFAEPVGDHVAKQSEDGKPAFKWRHVDGKAPYASVLFFMSIDQNYESSSLEVVLYNRGLKPLDVADWIKFGEWRDELLPNSFPGSQITVLAGPELNTAPELLEQIMAESGVSIEID